mmetsp:Transcript_72439/g.128702  ORF Transcript_72439/g.128702 Transcript_72439/m.128702 type:complete len:429 (-) Transcript_72439:120-1406(-)
MTALPVFTILLITATAAAVLEDDSSTCATSEVAVRSPSCLIQREQPRKDAIATKHVASEVAAPQPASAVSQAGAPITGKATAGTVVTKPATTAAAGTASAPGAVAPVATSASTAESATEETAQISSAGSSSDEGSLPEALVQLGIKLFGSKEKLDKVVKNSQEVEVDYIRMPMKLRIKSGDNAMTRLPEEGASDEYGIDSLLQEGATFHGMINVVDMGANYGVVPIALYKRYPGMVRAVVAEPIHSTYFFLRWNMYLNGVDDLTGEELAATGKDRRPGVLAVHRAVAEANKEMHVCWSPDNSMNAAMCDCDQKPFEGLCLPCKSISTEEMFAYFGKEGIDFLKMDCEGCERHSLPALLKMDGSQKLVKRLVGELHNVPEELEDIACKFNHQTWMTKVCGPPRGAGQQLECDADTRDKNCHVDVNIPLP